MTLSTIRMTKVGSRTVLIPKGPLTHQNCDELESIFNECISKQNTEIILDCKAVSFIDSEVLELLDRMNETLKNQGGILKMITMVEVCRDILLATRLTKVFHFYKNINDAIRNVP
jgi:anti-anti-sigma factor